ncbi:hypothetical protein PInf_002552 [Phytophthora infestans]|nr:hypothetical protein PInf_002552 [Phytophthora infestans]
MNATTNAKPKATFSSRNLSAVFKASLRTKPLPDNATGSLQRPNSRMRVLGRAAVAPPAPINTPSLKRQGQVHDVRVSLVPASSNWAESGIEKEQKSETRELEPSLADVVAPPEAPEKVWTSESVAEHLHTGDVSARPKITLESSGRWGDDAVEQDIVQNNICRQMLKERKFPDLKEAAEEVQMHHNRARTPTTDRPTSSMGLQQVEQHRGRATGRWAQMERPMQDNCWTHGASGGVVVLTDEQKGVEVSPEDEGFGTVKSRRAVLSAKKPLRLRLASTEDAAPVLAIDEELQSNGEQVQENVSIKYKVIDSQVVPEPRGKTANSRRNAEPGPKDRKPKMKQLKQANTKQVPGKAAAFAEANQPISPVKPTEQVAGEAPAESTVPKKRTQYGKVVRELKPRRQKQNLRKTSLSSAGGGHRKQEPPQRNVQKLSTPGQVVKVKPQQVRQVYVAKTPAPVSSAMSTAA